MPKQYGLICMSFDGEYVTERTRFEESWPTIDDAWRHADDMGSKWFFYPFPFVVSASGKTIVDTPSGLDCLLGRRVTTVKRLFKRVSTLPETAGMDADQYIAAVWDNAKG